jgi:hypothetical protein
MEQYAMPVDQLLTRNDIFDTAKFESLPYQITHHTDRYVHQVFPIGEGVITGIERDH